MATEHRRDRTGEPVDESPCGCDHGWLDRDADQPIPCTRCRPDLAPARLNRYRRGGTVR